MDCKTLKALTSNGTRFTCSRNKIRTCTHKKVCQGHFAGSHSVVAHMDMLSMSHAYLSTLNVQKIRTPVALGGCPFKILRLLGNQCLCGSGIAFVK